MTHQLSKWKSDFGNLYTDRNNDDKLIPRSHLWYSMLTQMVQNMPSSVLEIGAGAGYNLSAIQGVYKGINKDIKLTAVEPNEKARGLIKEIPDVSIIEKDSFCIEANNYSFDLSFTSGVLIHIHPDDIQKAMDEIYRVTKNYIVCIEYFSPELREIKYRGEDNLLWANDYGKLWMEGKRPLRVISWGFSWKLMTGLDNVTWWIFEKAH